jgi:prophage antirepressor-like protein
MGRPKKNVVVLCLVSDSSSGSEDVVIEEPEKKEKTKAITKKIIGDDQTITMNDGIVSGLFTYEDADLLVILDDESKPWYKGIDICDILEYVKARNAIATHVDDKYKKSYKELTPGNGASLKLDAKTIFISTPGVFQLVSRSKKPEAIKLWEFITETVLPELFSKGTYSLPAKKSDIKRLTKNFYDDNMISDYKDKLAIYLAYIGEYNGKHILKFGKSNDFVRRDLKEHRKMYKTFNVINIWETLANDLVETNIKYNFMSKNMLTSLTKKELGVAFKEHTKRELVILNEVNDLDYCLEMIENVVKNTILPQELHYQNKIKEMETNQETVDIHHKNDLLQSENDHLKEMNRQLKRNIRDLRNKKHNQ